MAEYVKMMFSNAITTFRNKPRNSDGEQQIADNSSQHDNTRFDTRSGAGALMIGLSRALRNGAYYMKVMRPFSYASEVAVASKSIIKPWMYNGLWGASFLYVGIDMAVTIHNRKDDDGFAIWCAGSERFIWHTMASLIFPAVAIHHIVSATNKVVNPYIITRLPRIGRYIPILVGIGSIPFIIHPLDKLADYIIQDRWTKLNTRIYEIIRTDRD